ncbi:zinc finger, CCHC-type containing protein [Tanacetum coccineum]|uniref:Zinc finger, CCHC-type containing protein n=1 Tax=Tanacetum coccineum TaxID=301880 RepID=A0ABQ5DTR1_9ASTR
MSVRTLLFLNSGTFSFFSLVTLSLLFNLPSCLTVISGCGLGPFLMDFQIIFPRGLPRMYLSIRIFQDFKVTFLQHRRRYPYQPAPDSLSLLPSYYSKPSHEGYRNHIELPEGNNVVPLRSDTIRLVQNECSFHGLRFVDPNQHLKDFLKLVDSLDLDVANRERKRLHLFQFSLYDQASNWLERLPTRSISTWDDLTTRFLAQFFPPRRTSKLCNDILMFQQHQGESLSEAWTRFKDLLQKVPHHGIDLWLQVQIFYNHIDQHLKRTIDYAAGGRLRKISAEKAWDTIEELAQYEDEGWNDPAFPEEESLNYKNPDIEQLLGIIENHIDALMKDAISIMKKSEDVFWVSSKMMHQLPPEPSRQEEFKGLVMNFILDQEER